MTRIEQWDRAVPAFSDDRLLLVETEHRVANEISAALAAMHLVRSAKGVNSKRRMLDEAVERLEGFAVVHRLLSVKPAQIVDVGRDLESLCTALARSRYSASGSRMDLDLPSIRIDGATGRRLMVVASELITNSIRYALEAQGGVLTVSLSVTGSNVYLKIADDGPGIDPSSAAKGTGIGTPLVGELVHRAGGRLLRQTGPDGTRIQVGLPFDAALVGRARQKG